MSLFEKLNIINVENSFRNSNIQFFVKKFKSILLVQINGEIENEEDVLVLANALIAYIAHSNFNKLEVIAKIKNQNVKDKLFQMLVKNNYNVDVNLENFEITLPNVLFYNPIKSEIFEILKNLGYDFNYFKINGGAYNNLTTYKSVQEFSFNEKDKNGNSLFKYLESFKKIIPIHQELLDLPKDKEELENTRVLKVIVEGELFDVQEKELKSKKYLYILSITDYQESIQIKYFSNSKTNFNVGDVLKVEGVLVFDDFSKTVVIMPIQESNIEKSDACFISEIALDGLFDENESLRDELHVHSTFSTQDGLSSVEDYFKYAKNFGIKSLAFVDHENVQSYPDIEKYSHQYEIKPIYGVECNLIDENEFKIFYKRQSAKRHLVGLDIETTGFSSRFDEITEISAYKIVGRKRLEYSVLVKIKDKKLLSKKISDLTSITLEMLESDGIDIKDALLGLVDFIDDGIIVAHNATFDVDFIEHKINQELGIKKSYSFIDTMNFSRIALKSLNMKHFSLDKVCSKLKIELKEHHRAIYDAIACFNIYFSLMNRLENIDLSDINCPNSGITYIDLKVNAKKQKQSLSKFLIDNDISYQEENLSSSESRINSLYKIECHTIEKYNLLKSFLKEESKIKVQKAYRKNTYYSDDFENLNKLIKEEDVISYGQIKHITILVKNQIGLKNLYKLISLSNTKRITSKGNVILSSDLKNNELRQNVLIGSSCYNGVFRKIYEKGFDYVDLSFYDYFELQPLECYKSISDGYNKLDNIKSTVLEIISWCKSNKKLAVFDTDAHYIYPTFKNLRNVYINTFGVGGVMHPLYGKEDVGCYPLLSTNNFLKQIKKDYGLDLRTARKLLIENTNKISSLIDDNISIVPDKLYTPKDDFLKDKVLDIIGHTVPSVKDEFEKIVYTEVEKYKVNGMLPTFIKNRLKKEMDSIVGHGFYIIYYIAYLLVKKSNQDGYVVGSRGSVGSSFVANLMGITEVNSLPPHYRCNSCHYQIYKGVPNIFNLDTDEYRLVVDSVDDGFDLPRKTCPICGKPLVRDGHDIPFETFLGFNGDKTPDIDLNFSGEYQSKAHNFCKEVFGEKHSFRAGTIGTVANKTAEMYLKKYNEKNNIKMSPSEVMRRSRYLTDVKRTTGQHPGGIIIIPNDMEIEDFTPIQYPANKLGDWYTTHLDYNAIHENVLKMDILGHDDPTILKFLMDLVKENPENYPFSTPQEIEIDDEKIKKYLKKDTNEMINSMGIPEFGTNFVKGMLSEIEPNTFAELVKVSGLSHGTDVWNNNAQDLVNGCTKYGKIDFKETIGCRDDIMVQLIYKGLKPKEAFDIMEFVRKGKLYKTPDGIQKWESYKAIMREKGVPEWYIWSCEQIKYMFPKAHAVAYVLSAMRIAWFKANRPLDFYQAFFTVRADVFDSKVISTNDLDLIQTRIDEIKNNKNASDVEINSLTYLEAAYEMIKLFGFKFHKPDLKLSHGTKFLKFDDKTLLMPFRVLDGVGNVTANSVYENRNDVPYESLSDLKKRGKADKKFVDAMEELNGLEF